MVIGHGKSDTTLGGTGQQTLLDQVRLVDVLDGVIGFADADGQGLETHRTAAETFAQSAEDGPGKLVQPKVVHPEECQAVAGHLPIDHTVPFHLGEIPALAKQPVGDTGGAAGASGDLGSPDLVEVHAEDPGGPSDNGPELVGFVVVEPGRQTEPVA